MILPEAHDQKEDREGIGLPGLRNFGLAL